MDLFVKGLISVVELWIERSVHFESVLPATNVAQQYAQGYPNAF